MRKSRILFAALALTLAGAPLAAQTFSAALTGAAEVPGPGDTDGVGVAVVSIAGTTVTYSLLVQNIAAPTLAHIHRGAAGISGPVVVDLTPAFVGGNATGTVTTTQALADEINANPSGFYVNVHNAELPAGAIRGSLAAPAVTETYYPTVVKSAGQNGTFFVSDFSILNPGTSAASVTAEFYAQSAAGLSAPSAVKTLAVPAGQQVVVKDVAGTLFGVTTSAVGAVRLTSSAPLRFTHRVLNDQRSLNAGSTLLKITDVTRAEAHTAGTLGLLSNASAADRQAGLGYRTNLGWFNPGATPVTVTLQARSNDGALIGESSVAVPGLAQGQQAVFAAITGVSEAHQAQADFFVTYSVQGGGLFVYATVVDNETGDGLYIAGAPKP